MDPREGIEVRDSATSKQPSPHSGSCRKGLLTVATDFSSLGVTVWATGSQQRL